MYAIIRWRTMSRRPTVLGKKKFQGGLAPRYRGVGSDMYYSCYLGSKASDVDNDGSERECDCQGDEECMECSEYMRSEDTLRSIEWGI
jgi:hypothetical protein